MACGTRRIQATPARTRALTVGLAALMLWGAGCSSDDDDDDAGAQIQSGTVISLADGMVEGALDGGTRRFLGIPFAAPPVGELRWRPPAPPAPWSGVRPAMEWGSPCPQLSSINGTPSENEDCLYLNVWTPDPAPAEPLPVMVWFHGGGNQAGSAADFVPLGLGGRFYDGRVLAETRNVVIVSTNYRLGIFGFFAHPGLAAEDPAYPYTGNYGLLDQRAALEWVRDNIAAFGGDPHNVTIFGESAGSFDVCLHVVSPRSRGLFHRAISQSGGCTTRAETAAEVEANANAAVAALGCDGSADVLSCIRQVPVASLLDAAGEETNERFQRFGPIVDGGFLPDQPRTLFAAGRFAKVPYILGANADEGTLFFIGTPPITTEEEYLEALQNRFGDRAEAVAAVYPVTSFASPQDALERVFGDVALVCSTYDSARRAAAGGADVYLYNFARPIPLEELAPLNLGATHGAEIAYVFGSVEQSNEIDHQIALAMQGYWTRLAHNGTPNGEGALMWPRYQEGTDERINFDAEISVVGGFRRAECELWWSLYDEEFD